MPPRVSAPASSSNPVISTSRCIPDVEGTYVEARRSPAHQIDDFRPPREQRTGRADVALLHGLVQPRSRDPSTAAFSFGQLSTPYARASGLTRPLPRMRETADIDQLKRQARELLDAYRAQHSRERSSL